jgi:DNA-binding IclR family transcriptional regulator
MRTTDGRESGERPAAQAPSALQERILRLLGMTDRPLKSDELEQALGLPASEAHSACRWLTDNGYIVSSAGPTATRSVSFWSLAEKGRTWAQGRGALLPVRLRSRSASH